MSTPKDSDGPALLSDNRTGMSKRDWLAGMAMQGMLAGLWARQSNEKTKDIDWLTIIASRAYEYADEMIVARLKE